MDNQIQKCKTDKDLKNKAEIFFRAAWNSYCTQLDPEDFGKKEIRINNGLLFVVTDDVLRAQHDFVTRCIKLLGSSLGNEKEVEELAWQQVSLSIANNSEINPTEVVGHFFNALSQNTNRSFGYVAPNHLFKFDEDAREIKIGPVSAVLSLDLISKLGFKMKSGPDFHISLQNRELVIQLAPVSWYVSVRATEGNVKEEAVWLINVAITYLRLSYLSKENHLFQSGQIADFFPFVGEVETMPLTKPTITEQGIIVDDNIKTYSSVPRLYVVNESVVEMTKEREFKKRAEIIFYPTKNSLARRFHRGLGWLTRGRQTVDRAERFLFFFTAIESLLSSSDHTAPIIQTISRYAATILSPTPENRADIARNIRSLYGTRSALVHTGERNVSFTQSANAQKIAESLYKTVMENVSLEISFQEFENSLSESSYGLPWPKEDEIAKTREKTLIETLTHLFLKLRDFFS